VLEVTDFKPMFIEQLKFLKNTKLPLVMPHIRTKPDNTEKNKGSCSSVNYFMFPFLLNNINIRGNLLNVAAVNGSAILQFVS
jgi:hypothetical protein